MPERWIQLREAIYRSFVSHLNHYSPDKVDLSYLNQELDLAHRNWQLCILEDGYQLGWKIKDDHFDRPLWQRIRSAAEPLTPAESLAYLRQCTDNRGCG